MPPQKIKHLFTLTLFLCLGQFAFSQKKQVDSLMAILQKTTNDTLRCQRINTLVEYQLDDELYLELNEERAKICTGHLRTAKKSSYEMKFYKEHLAASLANKGYVLENQSKMPQALELYFKGLKLQQDVADEKGIATSLSNIGALYWKMGEKEKAIEFSDQALKMKENNAKKDSSADYLNDLAGSMNNLGVIYQNSGKTDKALEMHKRTYALYSRLKDQYGMSYSLNNIGSLYIYKDSLAQALEYYQKSLPLRQEVNDVKGISQSYNNIGYIYYKLALLPKFTSKKNEYFRLAIKNCTEALKTAEKIHFPIYIQNAALHLAQIYRKTGDFKNSLEKYELFFKMRDSINNETNRKAVVRSQLKYEYEKQAAADSVAHAKESEIKNVELLRQAAEIKAKKNQQYALFMGLFLVVLFAGFMYNRFKVTQKQKVVIEHQKEIVEEQKKIVDEHQKEIMDSIHYARRIQMAQIPSEKRISQILKRIKSHDEP
jgi:tetratricopeptide (TPR) repeat protein